MKKLILSIAFIGIFTFTKAQKAQKEKFGIFKFHPLGLATSSLIFGREMFNKENTKSTVITTGIRYKNSEDKTLEGVGTFGAINQYNKWIGLMVNVERRFYVPAYGQKQGTWLDNNGTWGIYLAPAFKVDYNQNNFDKSYFSSIYDEKTKKSVPLKVENAGSNKYLGFTPTANIGLQFTIFQNMYIDLYIGGGLRIIAKDEKYSRNADYNYFGENSLIESVIIKEGVIPNGGINIGIRL